MIERARWPASACTIPVQCGRRGGQWHTWGWHGVAVVCPAAHLSASCSCLAASARTWCRDLQRRCGAGGGSGSGLNVEGPNIAVADLSVQPTHCCAAADKPCLAAVLHACWATVRLQRCSRRELCSVRPSGWAARSMMAVVGGEGGYLAERRQQQRRRCRVHGWRAPGAAATTAEADLGHRDELFVVSG